MFRGERDAMHALHIYAAIKRMTLFAYFIRMLLQVVMHFTLVETGGKVLNIYRYGFEISLIIFSIF